MSDDDATSDIASVASVATQPVIPHFFPSVPFALNTVHDMLGVISFAKSDNVKLHKKGTSQVK